MNHEKLWAGQHEINKVNHFLFVALFVSLLANSCLLLVLNYQNRSRIIELEQTIRNLEHNDRKQHGQNR